MQLQNLPKVLQQQKPIGKTSIVTGNVVKLMSPGSVAGNKILMKNSNLVQVGKNIVGKPTFVLSNKTGLQRQQQQQQQQIIVVTTGSNLRQVQTGQIVTTANNFQTFVSTTQTPTTQNTVKMIRGVQAGKPITFTVGLPSNKTGMQQLIHVPQKAMTIDGKSVTVQLAPGSGGQKTVTIVSTSQQQQQQQKNLHGEQSVGGSQKLFMLQKPLRKPDIIDQMDGGNDDLMMQIDEEQKIIENLNQTSPSLPEETAVSNNHHLTIDQQIDEEIDDDFGINEILNVDVTTDCQQTSTITLSDIMDNNIDDDDDNDDLNHHRDDLLKNDGFIHFDHQFENSIRDDLDGMENEPKIIDDYGDDNVSYLIIPFF